MGDVCDHCNEIAYALGNVNGDAFGDDYTPIIDVADILALSDHLEAPRQTQVDVPGMW